MPFQKVYVCIYDQKEYRQYKDAYAGHPVLEIVYGNIFNHHADCLITAANSFGMMDGGIDGHVNYFFDMIEKRVQRRILDEWRGELPVGCSLVFDTPKNSRYQYLCCSPTMRVPTNVSQTMNAYLAMRGALVECSKFDIKTVITPLLCRGVGCMDTGEILRQIKRAYDSFCSPTERDWFAISEDQSLLHGFRPQSKNVEQDHTDL
jgi:O-acetyl-ADP-ribose deacetylase (regulator of RNase III)